MITLKLASSHIKRDLDHPLRCSLPPPPSLVINKALARAVVDISNRASCSTDLKLKREKIGDLSTEMIPHVFYSFAMGALITVHVDVLKGDNDHHK